MPGFRLDEKVALVTGCSIGLGHHFVETLHDAGATIVACARRAELLEDLCKDLSRASWISADLGETAAREAIVPEVIDRHGRIDILVNNAGVGYPGRIETESLDDFRLALEVNVTAVWHLSKIAGAEMVAAGNGAIVNVASILGHVASAPMAQANYCASKGAIVNLTRELAVQWARRGVRVNALCPGYFPSEMTIRFWAIRGRWPTSSAACPWEGWGS